MTGIGDRRNPARLLDDNDLLSARRRLAVDLDASALIAPAYHLRPSGPRRPPDPVRSFDLRHLAAARGPGRLAHR